MNTYLQGRKIQAAQDRDERPCVETLHLIRKLRWIGMEEEAVRLQMQQSVPTGGVITVVGETD
jgi:hypothetical protein